MNDLPPPKIMAEGEYLRLVARGHWEYAERTTATGAVAIVAITDQQRLVLVEQFRIPLDAAVIELPAGLHGDVVTAEEESLATSAHRELLEETGYEAAAMQLLMTGPTTAGLANEIVTFFHATGLRKTGAGGGDEHERITIHEPPLDTLDNWIRERAAEGKFIDPKIFAGLYLVGRR